MELNQFIDIAHPYARDAKKDSMAQDNANKTAFALEFIRRLPTEPVQEDPPKIPSLGALAIPN